MGERAERYGFLSTTGLSSDHADHFGCVCRLYLLHCVACQGEFAYCRRRFHRWPDLRAADIIGLKVVFWNRLELGPGKRRYRRSEIAGEHLSADVRFGDFHHRV